VKTKDQVELLGVLGFISSRYKGEHNKTLNKTIEKCSMLIEDMAAFDEAQAKIKHSYTIYDKAYGQTHAEQIYRQWPKYRLTQREHYFKLTKDADGFITHYQVIETPHNHFSLLILALKYYLIENKSKACLAQLNKAVFFNDTENEYAIFTDNLVCEYFRSNEWVAPLHDMTSGFMCYLGAELTKRDAKRIANEQLNFLNLATKKTKKKSGDTSPSLVSQGSASPSSSPSLAGRQAGSGIFDPRSKSQGNSPDSIFGQPELTPSVNRQPLTVFSLPEAASESAQILRERIESALGYI